MAGLQRKLRSRFAWFFIYFEDAYNYEQLHEWLPRAFYDFAWAEVFTKKQEN